MCINDFFLGVITGSLFFNIICIGILFGKVKKLENKK